MKAIEYPIVELYLGEAKKALNEKLFLPCIAVCGIISEMMIRERAGDFKEKEYISRILRGLFKSGEISEEQFLIFENIRKIRNRYIHLDLGAEAEASFQGWVVEDDSIATLVSEQIRQSEDPESELIKFHRLVAEIDAKNILRLLEVALSDLTIKR